MKKVSMKKLFPEVFDTPEAGGISKGGQLISKEINGGDGNNIPLSNARHEKFAQVVAAGADYSAAYRAAYPHCAKWKDDSVWVSASKLAAKVRPRIEALQREAADAACIKGAEFRERLTRQFRALDDEGDIDGLVKVAGVLLKSVPGLEVPQKIETRDGGVTSDYVPPQLENASTEDLLQMLGIDGEDSRA